jgi:hypothetical protein
MTVDTVVEPRRSWRLADVAMAAVLVAIIVAVGVIALSSQALPSGPAYGLRSAGEQIRLAVGTPLGREQLRIQFARDRFHQAVQVVNQNRSDASRLIDDGSVYLDKAWRDLPSLSAIDQVQIRLQLTDADEDQEDAQVTLNM